VQFLSHYTAINTFTIHPSANNPQPPYCFGKNSVNLYSMLGMDPYLNFNFDTMSTKYRDIDTT